MKINPVAVFLSCILIAIASFSCRKSGQDPSGPYQLNYGDSILYLQPQSGDYIVYPTETRAGEYEGFPEGIEIDDKTGAINVTKSETGLRYRITHTAPDGTQTTTTIVLSGITFLDKFYRLSQNDSVAFPVYNALASRTLPVAGSVFDEGGGAHASGCDVQTVNGRINLAQSIRDGLFGNNPVNDDRRDIDIVYRLNDGSNKAVNKLRVRLYYYTSMAAVAPDLLETLQEREDQGVFLRGGALSEENQQAKKVAKPRPPCVVIIAN
jgi:hypothetical protein